MNIKIKNITKLVTICSLAFFMSLPLYSEIDFSKASFEIVKEYAEKHGSAEAQYELGRIYYKGKKIERDYAQALKWFKKSAKQGHVKSHHNVGSMYYYGEATENNKPNYKEAFKWCRASAEQGHAECQKDIGVMYYYGRGVKKDNIEAYKWFFISMLNGWKLKENTMPILESQMTLDQIKKAKDLALKWQKDFESKQNQKQK